MHLARAGWIRWRDGTPTAPRPPGQGPLAARLVLDDGTGIDITEAGTKKSLAIYLVRDPSDVPGHRAARTRPAERSSPLEAFEGILAAAGRAQIKGVLRNQSIIAGIGNAYSDEILHVAKMSPFKPASMSPDEAARLYDAMQSTLRDAVARSDGPRRVRAEEGEEVRDAGARQNRRTLPGLRRHRAAGDLRRLHPAVLPDLPDRRQAARRPGAVAAAQVVGRRARKPLDGGVLSGRCRRNSANVRTWQVSSRGSHSGVVQGVIIGATLAFLTAILIMNAAARAITTTVNGWSSIRRCGQPGNGILVRAACAKALPVVNVFEEAAYWTTTRDGAGRTLSRRPRIRPAFSGRATPAE